MRDHRACTDHRVLSNGDPRENGRVRSDGSAALDHGLRECLQVLPASRKWVVGKCCIRSDENIVRHTRAIPKLNAALDCDAVPHDDIVFDKGVIANVAVEAHFRTRKDMCVGPNPGTFADVLSFDDSSMVFKVIHYKRRLYLSCSCRMLTRRIIIGFRLDRAFGALTNEQAIQSFPEFETLLHELYALETQIGYLDLYHATMSKTSKQPSLD